MIIFNLQTQIWFLLFKMYVVKQLVRNYASLRFYIINCNIFQTQSDGNISNREAVQEVTIWVSLEIFHLWFWVGTDFSCIIYAVNCKYSFCVLSEFFINVHRTHFSKHILFSPINQASPEGTYFTFLHRKNTEKQYLELTKCNW